ncbi:fumarylacetoacetate hydrolase family protein [Streptomyces sp. NPDC096132]|uniref:fumarylacetoacetate hydrolase family protein n=1 Tax=Streptomyces sp. NPDC096132 TaxID=3366075 RepID=UPI00380590FF
MTGDIIGLVQIQHGPAAPCELAVVVGDDIFAPPAQLAGLDLMAALADWDATSRLLRTSSPEERIGSLSETPLAAPLTYPNKVICAGANYRDHMKEMGLPDPPQGAQPFFFLKPPTTSVTGPGAPVPMPTGPDVRLDYEAELGVVIGHRLRDVTPAQAMRHVAGYLVANDISARGHFRRKDPLGPPFGFDWIGHKGQDGFCPIGPAFVPHWRIADPQRLAIRTWVNGALRQDSSTSQMLVPVAEQIAALSRVMTLEPGDLVLTGTPAGVAAATGDFLKVGDEIRIEIEGVGALTNHVTSSRDGGRPSR